MFSDFYHAFYYSELMIASLVGLLFFRRAERPFNWLSALIILTLASELTAKYVAFGLHESNSIVYHIFSPIEYLMYVQIFRLFLNYRKSEGLLWLSVVVLFTLEVVNTIFFQSLSETNTNVMIAESVFLVLLSLALFNRMRQSPGYENIATQAVFWFNSAVLCYYSFNILIWGFHSLKVYLLANPPRIIYDFNLLLSGLLYMIYAISILLNFRSRNKILKSA